MSNWEQSIKEFINNGNYMDGEIHRVIGSFSVGDLGKRGGNKCIFSKYDVMKGTTINFYDTEGTITFDDNCYIEAYFGIGRGCNIDIGSGTVFNGHAVVKLSEQTNVTIGKDCLFASGLYMTTTDWHSIIDIESGKRINPSKSISIGDHVWLAEDVKILKGAMIGHDSIIGAGSVVTGYIPSNVVAVGVPARIIKTGVTWKRELI